MIEKQSVQFRVLNNEQCDHIIKASLRILERTGCVVHHAGARKLMEKAGCRIDGERVYVPMHVMENALRTVPSQALIYNTKGELAVELGQKGKTYFSTAFENQYIIDRHTGEKRLTTKKDAYDAGLVIQALDNIDIATGLCCVADCNPMAADIYETRMLLETTIKPQWIWQFTVENLKTQLEMFAAVMGGMDKVLEKPPILPTAGASTPLAHSEDALDKLMYMADLGLPCGYAVATMMGGTAPITLASSFALGIADTFIGLLITQLVNPGVPFISTCWTDIFDMSTMQISMSGPEVSLGAAAVTDIFHYLNIPAIVHLAESDCVTFDHQGALDYAMQAYTGVLADCDVCTFAGFIEEAMSCSLESLLYVDDVISQAKYIKAGITINEDTLDLDTIDEVGPNGNFLGTAQTSKYFRSRWNPAKYPTIRTSYENWKASGQKDYIGRAVDKVDEIVADGPQYPLAPEVIAKLDEICKAAEEKHIKANGLGDAQK